MAKKTVVVATCDMHDQDHEATHLGVRIAWDSGLREVDLCDKAFDALAKVLNPVIGTARSFGGATPAAPVKRTKLKRGQWEILAPLDEVVAGRVPFTRTISDPPARTRGKKVTLDASPTAVRRWAESQGLTVSNRGRVPTAVVQQFMDAHRSRRDTAHS